MMSTTPRTLAERVAGAPISWGVCEVPGWGWQYDAPTVLAQMAEAGLAATEFGPLGFLPSEPAVRAATLAEYGMVAVGGFVPVVLHDPGHDPVPEVDRELDSFVETGARTLVLAAATGQAGYDRRPVLDEPGWTTLLGNLDRLDALAAGRGIRATLHPHVGTVVEAAAEVERVLVGSSIPLTLDTGHLLIGGADPVALCAAYPDRVAHVHLKDVDAGWARRVHSGEVSYTDAVRGGMYRPLGVGDAQIATIVETLEKAGYQGWYVLEQDTILSGDPATSASPAPLADVLASIAFLRSLAC